MQLQGDPSSKPLLKEYCYIIFCIQNISSCQLEAQNCLASTQPFCSQNLILWPAEITGQFFCFQGPYKFPNKCPCFCEFQIKEKMQICPVIFSFPIYSYLVSFNGYFQKVKKTLVFIFIILLTKKMENGLRTFI